MDSHSQTFAGPARRGRLSDHETERRMLRSATDMVNGIGLTVSLDHISFEGVIRDADVSRSSAYRRWPTKDLFLSDLLRELATAASPAIADDMGTTEVMKRVVLEHLDWFETPELRGRLVIEVIRLAALADFESIYGSTAWRTYIAMHATFLSLADGQLRDELQVILARSERRFIAQIAGAWEFMAALFGYRLRTELNATFETLATLLSANLRGLILMGLSMPETATRRLQAKPFGAAEASEWSLVAMSLASIAFGFLEPDPAFEWGDEQGATIRRSLEAPALQRAAASRRGSSSRGDEPTARSEGARA
jgi:AcrR family transcriptional regulator